MREQLLISNIQSVMLKKWAITFRSHHKCINHLTPQKEEISQSSSISDPINAKRQLKIIKHPKYQKKVRLFLLMRAKSTQTPTTPASRFYVFLMRARSAYNQAPRFCARMCAACRSYIIHKKRSQEGGGGTRWSEHLYTRWKLAEPPLPPLFSIA